MTLLLTLLACVSNDEPGVSDASTRGPLAGAPLASAFSPVGDGFVADVPAWNVAARLGADGATFAGEGGDLVLAFAGWGRGSADRLEPSRPAVLGDRLEMGRGGATEWWRASDAGLQQGWDLDERPDGDGPLLLALDVSGASAALVGAEVRFVGAARTWRYAGLQAWDATGRALPAWFEVQADQVRIRVDDAGAVWPIHVDPVMTSAASTISGSAAGDYLGWSAGTGDFNCDGYADLAVGAPQSSGTTWYGAGEVHVYYGSSTGLSSTVGATLTGTADSGFGASVHTAGDVDNNGCTDLIVGAPSSTITLPYDGAAYVYLGAADGLSTTGTQLTGSAAVTGFFGYAVAGTGDVDGDGYDDVIIGEPGYSAGTGRAWIFAGSSAGVSTTTVRTLTGTQAGMAFGWAVTGSLDRSTTADTYADIAVGAPYYDSGSLTDAGRAVVYSGSSTFFTVAPTGSNYTGGSAQYMYGYAASLEGSYNLDAYVELIVDAAGATGGLTNYGRIYQYLGSSVSLATSSSNVPGVAAGSYFGSGLASVRDTDADGYEELALGAPFASSSNGAVGLFNGSSTGVKTSGLTTSFAGSGGETLGYAITSGDYNGDGYGDIAIGAPNAGSTTGQMTVHYGGFDEDGDGWVLNGSGDLEDCDDTNAAAHPGAIEVCDDADADEDCDGIADDAAALGATTWYADTDGDGYGDDATMVVQCDAPAGYVSVGGDCDDTTATRSPAASEMCDGEDVDEDCDGAAEDADDSATGQSTFYMDADADGYGGTATGSYCDAPSGYTLTSTDCDDADGVINPGATEVCNGVDDNCDGLTDDASAAGQSTWYLDGDGDGYGGATSTTACSQPDGYVATSTDCDDGATAIHPGAAEVCDAADTDEDCDGAADEADDSVTGTGTFYADSDGDGYGGDAGGAYCDRPTGYVADSSDCDDTAALINPAATEICDAADADEDCDGLADDADDTVTGQGTFYVDGDGDGYGGATTGAFCDVPSGYVADTNDCNDAVAAIHPGATEVCDAADTDEDCDGLADDADSSAIRKETFYADTDGDGYGGDTAMAFCDVVAGYVDDTTDCDDTAAGINPGATEVCDALDVDEDCDGLADNADSSATLKSTFYADTDGDGYGGDTASASCDARPGYVVDTTDCNDGSSSVYPGAAESVADAIDQDCDGGDTCYTDADLDGYAAADGATVTSPDLACDAAGESDGSASGDCDDADGAVHPDAEEVVGDAVDEDCDGVEVCYADVDRDGYTDGTVVESGDVDCTGAGELGAEDGTGDCDDASAAFHPGAEETDCTDPADYNCDGTTGYVDADGDSYAACAECDDGTAAVYPGATEIAGDNVDQDCDGAETCYADADGDGARATTELASTDADCGDAGEALATAAEDCDDVDAAVYPGATEIVGDAIDADCDGTELCYADADDDQYRPDGDVTVASADLDCVDSGEARDTDPAGDCDDASAAYNPGATEDDCTDPNDYNCDGSSGRVDEDADGWAACEECDDSTGAVNPDADEVCNDVDDDCDSSVDEEALDATTWYADADGDGYTDPEATAIECNEPEGYVAAATEDDCDDGDETSHPGATDLPDDGIDQDCDGSDATETGDTGDTDDTGPTGETGDDTGGKDDGTGCGCASTEGAGLAWSLALGALALTGRRRRVA